MPQYIPQVFGNRLGFLLASTIVDGQAERVPAGRYHGKVPNSGYL